MRSQRLLGITWQLFGSEAHLNLPALIPVSSRMESYLEQVVMEGLGGGAMLPPLHRRRQISEAWCNGVSVSDACW